MRLYMFEHCSLCFRVRTTAALKGVHLQQEAVLDDDSETMIALVGKRQIPILVKDDGKDGCGSTRSSRRTSILSVLTNARAITSPTLRRSGGATSRHLKNPSKPL
jgi:glutathione S-transferase